jgi:hypothetical protein
MYSQVPSWALFQRQQISEDDHRAQEQAERAAADALGALLADADRVSISEKDGVQEFSATFDLGLPRRRGGRGGNDYSTQGESPKARVVVKNIATTQIDGTHQPEHRRISLRALLPFPAMLRI